MAVRRCDQRRMMSTSLDAGAHYRVVIIRSRFGHSSATSEPVTAIAMSVPTTSLGRRCSTASTPITTIRWSRPTFRNGRFYLVGSAQCAPVTADQTRQSTARFPSAASLPPRHEILWFTLVFALKLFGHTTQRV